MSRNPPRHTIEHGGFSVPPRDPNSMVSRVERHLREQGNATRRQLLDALNGSLSTVSSALEYLVHYGRAHVCGTQGRAQLYGYGPAALSSTMPTLRRLGGSGTYDGAELRRNPGIPDERFRAFELPSMVNGERVPAKRITAQCVGALKDTRSVGG